MVSVGSFALGGFAVFIAWTLVRALRSGTIFSDGVGYGFNEQPRMFVSTMAIHGVGVLLFAWLAVGRHIAGF
jgi:hypothetical protein